MRNIGGPSLLHPPSAFVTSVELLYCHLSTLLLKDFVGLLFVWILPLDLTAMGDPTRSRTYKQIKDYRLNLLLSLLVSSQ